MSLYSYRHITTSSLIAQWLAPDNLKKSAAGIYRSSKVSSFGSTVRDSSDH